MNLWKPIDVTSDWLRHSFGPKAQLRMGVIMVLMGIAGTIYLPWSGEPPIIYIMSALALIFAGIGVVVSAETLIEVANDVEGMTEECADEE